MPYTLSPFNWTAIPMSLILYLFCMLALCFSLVLARRLIGLDFRRFALLLPLVFTIGIIIMGPVIALFGFGLLWYFPVLPRAYTLYFIHLFYSFGRQSTAVLISETIILLFLCGSMIAGFGLCRCFKFPAKKFILGSFTVLTCGIVFILFLWGNILA